MSYKIIVDSCGELPERCKNDSHFESVPLSMQVDDYHIIDDETFDQADFLKKVAESPNCPKSSCPSPERYMEAYNCEAEHVYAVTLSGNLSGSYNSAVLGKNLYHEEYGDKKIHVFDSCSASVGETLIALKIEECEKAGMSFEKTVEAVTAYRNEQNTYFVLETLEVLRKNGRLSNLKAFVANALNIKPYMGATPDGQIIQLGQSRGINRALKNMIDCFVNELKNSEEKIIAISHCNCPARAEMVKEEILKRVKVKDIFTIDTHGISSMYASDGGIILVG
ncbi:MAG: DegV family protein [Lachnospiraceae bacterium]|nr:DegV family protein [Lachnospiraceae bacterium]MEE1015412.1 DegV family protein [Lachnospiraceae bacterium]